MGLAARIVQRKGKAPRVAYRWDPETDILTGAVKGASLGKNEGLTGSVELEGGDGSFILLDVQGGTISGVEVVVWPDVRTVASLQLPAAADADVVLPGKPAASGVDAVEVDAALAIETNPTESVFRVRVGPARKAEAARVAEGLIVEVDERGEVAGLWLTDVPPFPAEDGS
jgi:hypothetical protein